ncbi:Yip1 family protein [Agrobacterium vitis]
MAFWAKPLNDREIIDLFDEILEKYPVTTGTFSVPTGGIDIKNISDEKKNKIKNSNGYSIQNFTIKIGTINFSYNRANDKGSALSSINITRDSQGDRSDLEFDFSIDVLKKLGNPPLGGNDAPNNSLDSHVIKIETALAGSVDQFAELQASFHKKNEELRTQYLNEIANLKGDLEGERRAFDAEMAVKRDELEKAKQDLDDRSNTIVRRAIRTEIKDSIKESLEASLFSQNTASQRTPVRAAYWIFILLAVAFTVFSSYQISQLSSLTASTGFILIAKASIGGFTTIGLALLYLKWETSWINQQADFERILSATRTDIDRASWVVESLLEWNREAQAPMPSELLSALTRRLFDWDAKVEENQTTADSLASAILGSASNLKLGPNGAEIDIGNKGIKRLQSNA